MSIGWTMLMTTLFVVISVKNVTKTMTMKAIDQTGNTSRFLNSSPIN